MSVEDSILNKEALIADDAIIVDSTVGEYAEIGPFVKLQHSSLGDYSYLYAFNDIIYCTIGKFVSIASNVRINPPNHPYDRAAQHHFTYRCSKYGFGEDDMSITERRKAKSIVIGNDVWIGHNSTIMGGVTIGDGAIVGAGSVVTHDVEPYTIVGGVPARFIKERFSRDIAMKLQKIKWWDWPHDLIKERLKEFNDVEAFVERYYKE